MLVIRLVGGVLLVIRLVSGVLPVLLVIRLVSGVLLVIRLVSGVLPVLLVMRLVGGAAERGASPAVGSGAPHPSPVDDGSSKRQNPENGPAAGPRAR